jgi:hypothetical protein
MRIEADYFLSRSGIEDPHPRQPIEYRLDIGT